MLKYKFILIVLLSNNLITPVLAENCKRIISFAPSISMILRELKISSNIIAKTKHDFVLKSKDLPSVGDLFEPNIEAIYRLKPDMVFLLKSNRGHIKKFKTMKIPFYVFEHRNVKGILSSVSAIGQLCEINEESLTLLSKLEAESKIIESKYEGKIKNNKVMLVIGNGIGLNEIYLSGSDGFYSDVLRLIGARNVYTKKTTSALSITKEGIQRLNPDKIFLIYPRVDCQKHKMAISKKLHFAYDKFVCFNDKLFTIPSINYLMIARQFAKTLFRGQGFES